MKEKTVQTQKRIRTYRQRPRGEEKLRGPTWRKYSHHRPACSCVRAKHEMPKPKRHKSPPWQPRSRPDSPPAVRKLSEKWQWKAEETLGSGVSGALAGETERASSWGPLRN